jgi:hypothetical protein
MHASAGYSAYEPLAITRSRALARYAEADRRFTRRHDKRNGRFKAFIGSWRSSSAVLARPTRNWIAAAMRIPKNAEILANYGLTTRPDDVLDLIDCDFPLVPPCERHRTIFDVRQLELKL